MLALTREIDESITLFTRDGTVTVKLLKTLGSRARIGVDAPLTVKIVRTELLTQATEGTGGTEAVLKQGDANAE